MATLTMMLPSCTLPVTPSLAGGRLGCRGRIWIGNLSSGAAAEVGLHQNLPLPSLCSFSRWQKCQAQPAVSKVHPFQALMLYHFHKMFNSNSSMLSGNNSAVVFNKMQQNQSNRARAEEEKTEAINLAGDADWRQGEGGN